MALNAQTKGTEQEPLTRRGFLGAAVAAAVAGPALLRPSEAEAQDRVSANPAWIDAARWARSHDGVAVMVNLGSDARHQAGQIDQAFRAAFWNRFGVHSRVFFELEDRSGTVVTYYMRDDATEPALFREAATPEAMQDVVDRMRFYDRLGPEVRERMAESVRRMRLRDELGAAPAPQG